MYASRLGIIPLITGLAEPEINSLLNQVETLFQGSSYDATHQSILAWTSAVLANPSAAAGTPIPGSNWPNTSPAGAWLALRCWAGDQTVNAQYRAMGTDSLPNGGCGCEVAHGCRADAQSAVNLIHAQFPSLVIGSLSSNPTFLNAQGLPTTPYYPINTLTGNSELYLIAGVVIVGVLLSQRRAA